MTLPNGQSHTGYRYSTKVLPNIYYLFVTPGLFLKKVRQTGLFLKKKAIRQINNLYKLGGTNNIYIIYPV